MNELPSRWNTLKFGDVVKVKYGKSLETALRNEESQYPVVGSAGVMTKTSIPLVSNPVLVIGRKGNVGSVQFFEQGCYPIDTTYYMECPEGLNLKFLKYQLIAKELVKLDSSTATPSLRREDLETISLIIPPIAEQSRIVEILEDHLSRLDAALSDVKQARVKAAQFRRSLLQAAFNGTFSKNRIDTTTKLPNGWKWLTLNDVAKWGSGGTPKSSDKRLYGGEIPWIVIGDLTEGLVNETTQRISQKGLDSSSAKLMPPGTVMIAMYGASIGRTGIMAKAMTTNQAIACGIVDESIMTQEYLLYYLQSQRQDFVYAGKGGAQPNISQGVVKAWKIPVPPVAEQVKIIQRIEEQLSHLEHAAKVALEIELSSKSFRRSLLQAAFTGQLTEEVANV